MKVVVIGATGTIGREVVKQLGGRHEVLKAARNSGDVAVDITSPDSIRRLFEAVGHVDAVVCAAGDAVFKQMPEMTDDDYSVGLTNKLLSQTNLVRIGQEYIADEGSFTLTSGVTSRQPLVGTTSYSMVNGGVEGFVRAAALELPRRVRVNAVCPQWVNSTLEMYGMDPSWGVPVERVARGYVESVEGTATGMVIDAGWTHDWTAHSLSIGTD